MTRYEVHFEYQMLSVATGGQWERTKGWRGFDTADEARGFAARIDASAAGTLPAAEDERLKEDLPEGFGGFEKGSAVAYRVERTPLDPA